MAARIAQEIDRETERKRAFAAKQGRIERGGGNAAARFRFMRALDRCGRVCWKGADRSTLAARRVILIGLNQSDRLEPAKL